MIDGARHPGRPLGTRGLLARGVLIGASVGLLVASGMSFLDWRLNPGGLFHGESGTSWRIVWKTWTSWFVPVFLLAGGFALAAIFVRPWRRGASLQ